MVLSEDLDDPDWLVQSDARVPATTAMAKATQTTRTWRQWYIPVSTATCHVCAGGKEVITNTDHCILQGFPLPLKLSGQWSWRSGWVWLPSRGWPSALRLQADGGRKSQTPSQTVENREQKLTRAERYEWNTKYSHSSQKVVVQEANQKIHQDGVTSDSNKLHMQMAAMSRDRVL